MKKTSCIQALAMIMVLCLFIYSMTEFRLRRELLETGETVTSQTKKQTQRPTLKWTFFLPEREGIRSYCRWKPSETDNEPESDHPQ